MEPTGPNRTSGQPTTLSAKEATRPKGKMGNRSVTEVTTTHTSSGIEERSSPESRAMTEFNIESVPAELKIKLTSLPRLRLSSSQHSAILAAMSQHPELIPNSGQYMQMMLNGAITPETSPEQLADDMVRFLKSARDSDKTLNFSEFGRFRAGKASVEVEDDTSATGQDYQELQHQLLDYMKSGTETFSPCQHPLLCDIPKEFLHQDLYVLQVLLGTDAAPACAVEEAEQLVKEFCNHVSTLKSDPLPFSEAGSGLFAVSAQAKWERILLEDMLASKGLSKKLNNHQKNHVVSQFHTNSENMGRRVAMAVEGSNPSFAMELTHTMEEARERLQNRPRRFPIEKPVEFNDDSATQFFRHVEVLIEKDLDGIEETVQSCCLELPEGSDASEIFDIIAEHLSFGNPEKLAETLMAMPRFARFDRQQLMMCLQALQLQIVARGSNQEEEIDLNELIFPLINSCLDDSRRTAFVRQSLDFLTQIHLCAHPDMKTAEISRLISEDETPESDFDALFAGIHALMFLGSLHEPVTPDKKESILRFIGQLHSACAGTHQPDPNTLWLRNHSANQQRLNYLKVLLNEDLQPGLSNFERAYVLLSCTDTLCTDACGIDQTTPIKVELLGTLWQRPENVLIYRLMCTITKRLVNEPSLVEFIGAFEALINRIPKDSFALKLIGNRYLRELEKTLGTDTISKMKQELGMKGEDSDYLLCACGFLSQLKDVRGNSLEERMGKIRSL